METTRFPVRSTDGWMLDLRRHRVPGALDRARRPLVMVPGYAMNTFILGFHPQGPSMIEALAADGVEVWTADLRGQGGSRRDAWRRGTFGLRQLVLDDLHRSIQRVRGETEHDTEQVDLVGCSLGGSMVYAWLAHHPADHGVHSVVAIGAPLRWEATHPAMRLAFTSPRLAGVVPIRGTRALARAVLPVLTAFPPLLSIYMNADRIDLSQADQLVRTVEDPVPFINRQIARWMKDKDLVVDGVNVSQALPHAAGVRYLCVLANADGIVPPESALALAAVVGRERVDTLSVGDDTHWYAHADLFIGESCQADVFDPMRAWLRGEGLAG